MKFKQGDIDGVVIKDIVYYNDQRGWLAEIWRTDELKNVIQPAMAYMSATHPGVTRGPHEHTDQTDYFVFLSPSLFNIRLWDNRKDSPTYGNMIDLTAGEGRSRLIIVPPGVVHGYRNIGKTIGLVFNLPDRLFKGAEKKDPVDEIRHENQPDSPFQFVP